MNLIDKVFGTHSERELKKINPIVDKIEALDESMQKLSDEELKNFAPVLMKMLNDKASEEDIKKTVA